MESERDYIYVEDVVEALSILALYGGKENVFNLGTGEGSSVWDIVKFLESIMGCSFEVQIDPAKVRKTERPNLIADISLIRQELSWSPSTSMEEGLKKTLKAEGINVEVYK